MNETERELLLDLANNIRDRDRCDECGDGTEDDALLAQVKALIPDFKTCQEEDAEWRATKLDKYVNFISSIWSDKLMELIAKDWQKRVEREYEAVEPGQ
ncbi:MAG: hypothetical protein ACRDGM_18010 [bacterium]